MRSALDVCQINWFEYIAIPIEAKQVALDVCQINWFEYSLKS